MLWWRTELGNTGPNGTQICGRSDHRNQEASLIRYNTIKLLIVTFFFMLQSITSID